MCDSFSQHEGSEFMAQSIQKDSVSCPGESYWKSKPFQALIKGKNYCWQVQKLVKILLTGEVAYETKIEQIYGNKYLQRLL